MDPLAGNEITATTTCTADNGTFCTQYTTVFPSTVVGDVVFALGLLVFFATVNFLVGYYGTFTKNER